jgi:hypothetical protein
VWDLKRFVASSAKRGLTADSFALGNSFDLIDLSLDTTVTRHDAQAYWCCFMAKHGPLGRFLKGGIMSKTEFASVADAVTSLIVSLPLLLDCRQAVSQTTQWSGKGNIVMSVLGSMAVEALRTNRSASVLCVFLASALCREGWMDPGQQTLIVFKCLEALAGTRRAGTAPSAKSMAPACLDPVHQWLELVTCPCSHPSTGGFEWCEGHVNWLLARWGEPPLCSGALSPRSPVQADL